MEIGAVIVVLLGVFFYHALTNRHDAKQAAIAARAVPETVDELAKETAESGGACLLYAIAVIALVFLAGLLLMGSLATQVAQYGH